MKFPNLFLMLVQFGLGTYSRMAYIVDDILAQVGPSHIFTIPGLVLVIQIIAESRTSDQIQLRVKYLCSQRVQLHQCRYHKLDLV
ncbi:hypothetical protein RRG08_049038 [Elysia crispata]|uniref:Uncharacterized protein n=1 Tax=Elysia crispata TaxID=231223 RepID=A0AAE0ZS68_9GAST|nr:hypothetical protein RRG08_049038 [Elysia crispata]